jgi:hypothetical protein
MEMSSRQQAEALVLIDEPNVRVTEHRFQPGAETGWRRHMADDVVVPLARHLASRSSSTLKEVSANEGMGAPYAARVMRLNFLAPDIVVAILNGRQPITLNASKLMADTRLPLDRSEQRKALGFARTEPSSKQQFPAVPPRLRLRSRRPNVTARMSV